MKSSTNYFLYDNFADSIEKIYLSLALNVLAKLTTRFWDNPLKKLKNNSPKSIKNSEKFVINPETEKPKPNQHGYVKIGVLKEIDFYPFKGCQTVSLKSAVLTPLGLKTTDGKFMDRSFAVYRPDTNSTVSPKFVPRLSLISVELLEKHGQLKLSVNLNHRRAEQEINFATDSVSEKQNLLNDLKKLSRPYSNPKFDHLYRDINILKKTGSAFDCGEEASLWVTTFLHKFNTFKSKKDIKKEARNNMPIEYRIVYFDHTSNNDDSRLCERDTEPEISKRLEKIGQTLPENQNISYKTGLADTGAYTLVTDQSIQHVRDQVALESGKELHPKAFRINLIIDSDEKTPFSEDQWDQVIIGNFSSKKSKNPAVLKYYYKCQRCFFTTVEPRLGQHRSDNQPLTWLNEHRKIPEDEVKAYGGGVKNHFGGIYGMVMDENQNQIVSVGDDVWVKFREKENENKIEN